MDKLISAAKEGFVDSILLAVAIPVAIVQSVARVIKAFLFSGAQHADSHEHIPAKQVRT
jgi:hypothetical protein